MANYFDKFEELEETNSKINTVQSDKSSSYWDNFEEIQDEPTFNDNGLIFEDSPTHPYFDAAKGLLKGGVQKTQNVVSDFGGALKSPVQNPNVAQGLGNVARDLGQFGTGLVQGIPQFLGNIKNQAVETGANLQQDPNNWGSVIPAIGQGVDKALGDMVSGVLNLPESIAASYKGREVNPHFTSVNPVEFYADSINDFMYDKGLISQKQYDDYYKHKIESIQKQSQVPLAETAGEFLPAMIPIGKAAGLLGGAGKTAQAAGNLSKAQKIAQTAKDIGKAGAVGAGYGFVVNPDASLAERSQAAGSGMAAGALLGAGGKAIQAGGRAAAPHIHNAAKNTAYAAGKGAKTIVDVAGEIKDRLNPKNYETISEATPVEVGEGLSRRTVYETKQKTIYKRPNDTKTVNQDIPQIGEQKTGTDFVMGEGSELKTPAKPERIQKLLPMFEESATERAGALDRTASKEEEKIKKLAPNTVNKIKQEKSGYQTKHYKVIKGKTYRVDENGNILGAVGTGQASVTSSNSPVVSNKVDNIAPNTVKKLKAAQFEKRKKAAAWEILSVATGKSKAWLKMSYRRRGDLIEKLLEKVDDKLTVSSLPDSIAAEYYTDLQKLKYKNDTKDNIGLDYEIARQAYDDIFNNNFKKPENIIETRNAELNDYYEEAENAVKAVKEKIANSGENAFDVYDVEANNLFNKYPKSISPETYEELLTFAGDIRNQSLYNKNKEVENEYQRSIDENNGRNGKEISGYDAGNKSGNNGKTLSVRGNSNEKTTQTAIEGLEEESAKAVQKQQNEIAEKENKEKYSTTHNGSQQQMFNTEQFKNGQQMLFDTSDMPKSNIKDPFDVAAEDNNKFPSIEDYKKPKGDYYLPNISQNYLDKLGKTNKPVVLKSNIIEKNKNNHPEIPIEDYNDILNKGIYEVNTIFKTNPNDEYYNFVHYDKNNNSQVLIELSENKDNYEIVNFYKVNNSGLARKLKKAIKKVTIEGGQVLIDNGQKPKHGDLSEVNGNSNNIITDNEKNFNPTEQVEAKSEQVKPKESTSKKPSKKKESKKLDDAGEFLQGNRKQDTSLTWDDLKDMNDLIRAKNTTKARVYPKPTIEDLRSEGFSEFQAGVILNVYNKINAKPAAGYDTIEHQKQYVDTINEVMSNIKDYIKSHSDEFTTDLIAEADRKYRSWSYDFNKSLFDVVFPDKENKKSDNRYSNIFRLYPEYNRKAIIVGGNKFTGALQLAPRTLIDVMKAIEDSKKVKESGGKVKKESWEKNFVVLEPDRWNKEYAVANKKTKHILAKYPTKEEAIAAAQRVQEKIDELKDKKANFVRNHIERRENNRDVTTEELQKAFGFRGVNFGNWTNTKERQNFVNYAYDSLYDLAELLNLPPKAISLNGQLGLAYGAQGHGGKAAAHYIPEYKDINLTKEYGAGSLAHEWWHAIDNYFGNQATNKEYSREWALSLNKGGELRPELFEALENLQTQIKKAPFTEEDIKKNAERLTARYNRNIEYYADDIKNDYKRAKNADELIKIVDDLVNNKEKYKTYTLEQLHEIENKFFKLLPGNRDTLTNRGKFNWLLSSISRLNDIDELARKGANKSEYLQNAEKIDSQSSGKKYWSEDTELGARAFAAYIFDKMADQNILNRFLARSGGGAVLNLDAFKELAEGEEKESLTISTTPKGLERKRIFDAFNKLFDTIKTRETDRGVELYSVDIPKFMEKTQEVDTGYKDIELDPIYNAIQKGIKGKYLADLLPNHLAELINQYARNHTFRELVTNNKNIKGKHNGEQGYIKLNLKAIGNNPYMFVKIIAHELAHAKQHKTFLQVMAKPKSTWTPEERTFVANYKICKKVNNDRQKYYNEHKQLIDSFANDKFYSAQDRADAIFQLDKDDQKIIITNDRNYNNYKNASNELEADIEGLENAKGYKQRSRYTLSGMSGKQQSNSRGHKKRGLATNSRNSDTVGEYSAEQPGYKKREVNTSDEINKTVRDKVYEWHGNIGKDRYDVDKALNSFIKLTKGLGKEYSKKYGMKVSDKMVREIMPFLRERTGLPEKLNRPELKKLFDNLSGTEKARLTKLADDISAKFDKYYKNYQEAKGVQDSENIENHISHIWDLDNKKKSLMTNYFATSSKFAKNRTIDTLIKGIDGFEVNGELIQFKPKTLDYAEILKSSSDNLIKSAHDSILADEIKSLKYNGEPLVLPASKAPDEWVEVNHPALNKAVYMGSVGEKELPMLMKTPVKVHPEIADYVSSIFEVQKNSKFWNAYDSLNGMVKQALLGFSGFHGYALSESSIGNAGVKKTLKELNPKKFVDAIKNGNYDVYKNEEAAKKAIDAGVQLGTPSDLQRNLVEDTLKKVPLIGKYIAGGVSANNKILWDVLHNNFKVLAFNTAIENLGKNVTKEQERAVAQWVNDSFGGQAWALLGIKPSTIKAASRVLLSPDWNFSTIRQAAAAINSDWLNDKLNQNPTVKRIGKTIGIGEEIGSKGARGKIGRGFWLRSAIFFTVFYNLMNAAFREKDRKEHPELYPEKMSPMDYSIWSNSYPMDNTYDKIMPKVFIGRNSDGTSRMLRVGKQFREVPEFITEPVTKLGGKTSPIINTVSQTALGMSPGDVVNKLNGKEAYLNQDIWNGYGEDAKMREGMDLAKGRVKALGKSLTPFIATKYIGGKHEFSVWDFFAQTNAGASKSKVYRQTMEALKQNKGEKTIDEIKKHAYQDGLKEAETNKMIGYATKNYKTENTKTYKRSVISALESRDNKKVQQSIDKMRKKHLSKEEQKRIYEAAYKDYMKNNRR